ncbi:MAG TPA: 2-dehydropantoate 2-reductase N-terminal domain-containing protein, partial [Gemmatimonadaceae bacterium]
MICAVLGAGAWGAALADRLARNAHDVRVWAYEPDVAESINSTHQNRFLADVTLAESIRASTEMKEVVSGAEFVVLVAPSHVTRAVAEAAQPWLSSDATIVVASKGIEQHSLDRMSEVAANVFG